MHILHQLNNRKQTTTCRTEKSSPSKPKTWTRFQFHSPMIYRVMNHFKSTSVKVALKATNPIFQQLTCQPQNSNHAGIHGIRCNACRRSYVGQTGRKSPPALNNTQITLKVTTRYQHMLCMYCTIDMSMARHHPP
jgi:hypothetical protein